jgi:hypothetical protein
VPFAREVEAGARTGLWHLLGTAGGAPPAWFHSLYYPAGFDTVARMRCLLKRSLVAGALAVLAGCGANTSTSGDCRLIESHYTRTDTASSGTTVVEVTCTFDRGTLTLSCTTVPVSGGSAYSSTVTWANIDDFMANHRPVGKLTYSHSTSASANCAFTSDLIRDSAGRPVSQPATAVPATGCSTYRSVFTAWDDAGRQTEGTRSGVGALEKCVDQPLTWSYDDVALTFTNQAGAATGCSEMTTVWTYDTDSLFVSSTTTDANGTRTSTYTVLGTTTVCR